MQGRFVFWAEWDRQRLQNSGGILDQYKHPYLIGDPQFAEGVHRAAEVGVVQ
jgi:hypothetical protein